MKQIEINEEQFKELKRLYQEAKDEGYDSFVFLEMEFLVSYAAYLIEFLESKFNQNE